MPRRAFTLLEVLVTIAILAALIVGGVFTYISVTAWARETSDKTTLTTLNDALTRYKTQGGGATALTAGTNIRTLLGRLQTGVTWAGKRHQFLQAGFTYPARSLQASGTGAQYAFYRANTYTAPNAPAAGPSYPYGEGVGYAANNPSIDYQWSFITSTGAIAVKPAVGSAVAYVASGQGDTPDFVVSGSQTSITFWSCVSSSDPTPAGVITTIIANSGDMGCNLTEINLQGLTGLASLSVSYNSLTSINLSGTATLGYLDISGNMLNSSALNTIYTALPDRTSLSAGEIIVNGNPGTASDTPSIATAKNWTVTGS